MKNLSVPCCEPKCCFSPLPFVSLLPVVFLRHLYVKLNKCKLTQQVVAVQHFENLTG